MLSVSWWCSATGQAWSWHWRAYPGVWLFVVALAAAYAWLAWGRPPSGTSEAGAGRRRLFGTLGLATIWLLLDWPVGTLGSGYLVAVHAGQFLLFSFVVPPLLYGGVAPHRWAGLEARLGRSAAFRATTHPVVTGIAFNVMAVVTHLPGVVDGLMRTQPGAFAIDLAWIAGGLAFWWPVLAPFPARRGGGLARIGYLFLASLVHSGIGMWLLLSTYPVYATYELAPPINGRSIMTDQAIAGGIMELIGGLVVLGAIAVIFFAWAREQDGAQAV